MNEKHSTCEDYEPLISAMIDGELDAIERNELNSHLQNCAHCKQRVVDFEEVDRTVDQLSHVAVGIPRKTSPYSLARPPYEMRPSKLKPRFRRRTIWRLIPLAAAATLLIGLGVAVWPNPRPVSAELISAEQFVEPLKELHLLNQLKHREQEVMLQTLGLDLRSMKLELNLLEPADQLSLNTRIDAMLEKLNRFDAKHDTGTH